MRCRSHSSAVCRGEPCEQARNKAENWGEDEGKGVRKYYGRRLAVKRLMLLMCRLSCTVSCPIRGTLRHSNTGEATHRLRCSMAHVYHCTQVIPYAQVPACTLDV